MARRDALGWTRWPVGRGTKEPTNRSDARNGFRGLEERGLRSMPSRFPGSVLVGRHGSDHLEVEASLIFGTWDALFAIRIGG